MSRQKHARSIDEALAECLDALEHGESALQDRLAQYPEYRQQLLELLSLRQPLASLGQLSPRRAFAESAKQELMAKLPDRSAASRPPLSRLWQFRLPVFRLRAGTLISALAILTVIFLVTHGVHRAASAAGPGDLLYGLNLKLEHVQKLLTRDAKAATRLRLDLANKRLAEVQDELEDGDIGNALIALQGYKDEMAAVIEIIYNTSGPERYALLDYLARTRLEHLDILRLVLAKVPASAQSAVQHAIEASGSGDDLPISRPEAVPSDRPDDGEPWEEAALPEPPLGTPEGSPVTGTPRSDSPEAPIELPAGPPVGLPILPGPPTDRPAAGADAPKKTVPTIESGPRVATPIPPRVPTPPIESGPPAERSAPPTGGRPPEARPPANPPGPAENPAPPADLGGPPEQPGPPPDARPSEPGPPANLPGPPDRPSPPGGRP